MPVSKIRKSAAVRKNPKPMSFVEFTLEGFEGAVKVPDYNRVPLKVQRRLTKNDLDALLDFFGDHECENAVEVFDELEVDEVEEFFSQWAEASGVNAPK